MAARGEGVNTDTALAVVFAVLSAIGYAAGAVAQERLASRAATGKGFGWWLAVGGNVVGAVLHVLALRYGALSVVQPLGTLTLVFALPLGALALSRQVQRTEWLGAGLTVAGLGVLLALVPAGGDIDTLGSGETYGLVAVVTATIVAVVWFARLVDRPVMRGGLLGVAAGIAFALASTLTQAVAVGWADAGLSTLAGPVPVLLGVSAVAGVLLSQAAYRDAGLAVPLTALTLSNPVAAAVIGMSLLGEGYTGGRTGALVALAAAAVAVRGVLLLTGHDAGADIPATGSADPVQPSPWTGDEDPALAGADTPARHMRTLVSATG